MLRAIHHFDMADSTKIRIASRDRMLALDLLEPDENRVETGMSNTIDGDTEITYQATKIQKGVGGPEISEWVLQLGTGVSASLVGNWIYERLKDKGVESLEIEGEDVDVDAESIQETLDKYTDD
jgi:hypothetical protein